MLYKSFMEQALDQARAGLLRGEGPVGAVLVDSGGAVVAANSNRVEEHTDPTAHAEILVLRHATQVFQTPRLTGFDLYVSLVPCPMCAQAISLARIRRLYFGAADLKGGGVDNGARIYSLPSCNHKPEVYGGICEQEAGLLLKKFFRIRR